MALQSGNDSSTDDEAEIAVELLKCANSLLEVVSDSDDELIACNLASVAAGFELLSKRKISCWMKEWITKRNDKGSYNFLTTELKSQDPEKFNNYRRMDEDTFQLLLSYIEKDLKHQATIMRNAISPEERLSVTLRYLATGESYKSLHFQTRLSKSFLVECVPQVCEAIWENLIDKYMKFPTTTENWEMIAKKFMMQWQFPLCLGNFVL